MIDFLHTCLEVIKDDGPFADDIIVRLGSVSAEIILINVNFGS